MWVDGSEVDEVEPSRGQVDHGPHSGEAGVASGFSLGTLEQAIEGFDETVGLSGLGPGDSAVETLADHPDDVLQWRDARAHDVGTPLPEHGGDDIDLLAVEDFTQMFATEPGGRCICWWPGRPGHQGRPGLQRTVGRGP